MLVSSSGEQFNMFKMGELTLEERLEKIRSPNLENQKKTAVVLKAVDSTLLEQDANATPTAYFAALLSLLDHSVSDGSAGDNLDSIIYLLDIVTPHVPKGLLRARFIQILSLLGPVLIKKRDVASVLRSSIGCLESLLLAQDAAAWEHSAAETSPRRAVAGLLQLSVDPRAKVRKRALEALKNILSLPPPGPSLDHPASSMCAETALSSLKDLAKRHDLMKEKRDGADAVHNPDLIHALHLVRSIAQCGTGWPSKKIEPLCELLLDIARVGNEYMSVGVLEVFEMIFQGMTSEISSSKLHRLLEIIATLQPSANNAQLIPPWIAIISRGYDVSAQVEPEETFYKIPKLFDLVSPYLRSPSRNVRISASECLISFLANCIPNGIVLEPSIYDEKILTQLARIAEDFVSIRYQIAKDEVSKVLEAMFDAVRWRADPFFLGVVKIIGELRGSESMDAKRNIDKVIGSAVRAVGPATVLKVLPHNLTSTSQQDPGRAWLLPLFRDHTTNTQLADFRAEFIPLSNVMFQRVLDNVDKDKTTETKIYETIVQQIWSIFSGYCDLPLDLKTAFDADFAELLANLLYQQVGLRGDICRGLKILIESNQAVAAIVENDDLFLQCRVCKAEAKSNLEYLGKFAGQYLAVLFNIYGQTLAQSRGPLLQTINAFLSITPPDELVKSFDAVCNLMAIALQEQATSSLPVTEPTAQKASVSMPSTSHTLMDLFITMAVYLPRESYSALFEVASLAIVKKDDPQLQKKAYKLIPRLAESNVGKLALIERHQELQSFLIASTENVSSPARRERLAALATLLTIVPDEALHLIPTTLSEVVISCKEQNERARATAFEILVIMGRRMISADGVVVDNSKVPGMQNDAPVAVASLEEFFTMVSAGLAGSTPHMVSASITAISRILYEFYESVSKQLLNDLIQTVGLFLASNNREIVRSVLGFVKVCVTSLPVDLMKPRLPSLIPELMVWSHEHKGHFRAKVKHILDRMVRRFGFEAVNKSCPDEDRKLITNIRKTKERKKKNSMNTNVALDGSQDAGEQAGGITKNTPSGRFESEFEEAIYSSSSDDDVSANENDDEATKRQVFQNKSGKRRNVGGEAFIIEDEGEPLDLLDRKAVANITSTRPVMLRKPTAAKARFNSDGKLVLGEVDEAALDHSKDSMDIDGLENGVYNNGVNAYLEAVSGKDVPKRGFRGKLKWSNKKGQDNEGDVGDDEKPKEIDFEDAESMPRPGSRREKFLRGRARIDDQKHDSQAGRGKVRFARRGLGEAKQRGTSMTSGRVTKPFPKRR